MDGENSRTRFAMVCLAQSFIGLSEGCLAAKLLGGELSAAFSGAVFRRVELHLRNRDAKRRKEEDGEGRE